MRGYAQGDTPPRAAFDYIPMVCEGTCSFFIDKSSGSPTSWRWSFPGAIPSVSSDSMPRDICYGVPGTYPVILIVANSAGADTVYGTITIRPQKIEVDSIAHPARSRIQLDTALLGTTVCDSIVLHNRGDITVMLTAAEAHMFRGREFVIALGQFPLALAPGERRGLAICYTPSGEGEQHDGLVLVDSCLTIATYIYAVGVMDAPRADFRVTGAEPCRAGCLDFADASARLPGSWRWSFPGAVPDRSTERNPRGICFTSPGEHAVTLIAANIFGADTIVRTIMVEAVPRRILLADLSDGVLRIPPSAVGTYRWDSLMIGAADAPLAIASARMLGNTRYSIPPGQFPLTIPAGESRPIRFCHAPALVGEDSDTLLIDNDCDPLMLPIASAGISSVADASVCTVRLGFGEGAGEGYLRVGAPYPNPARSSLSVPVELALPDGVHRDLGCVLYDQLGTQRGTGAYVRRSTESLSGARREEGSFLLDVTLLPQGAYFITIGAGRDGVTLPVFVRR